MRAILHAKFGNRLPKPSCASQEFPLTSSPLLRDSSVEEFEAALTKAQAAWQASRGRTRTATCNAPIAKHGRNLANPSRF